jgi:hypothetical protein
MVAGGKQDRAFAETTIIPPNDDENFVPVFCVEKGRWENRLRNFRYAGPGKFIFAKANEYYQKTKQGLERN